MKNEQKVDKFVNKIEPYLIIVIISSFVGVLGGVLGALFLKTIDVFVELRNTVLYIILLMPIIGLLIVYINKKYKNETDGIELVHKAAIEEKDIKDYTIPSLYLTTTLSHFVGASVGRMETPIKMGGALGVYISKIFNLKKENRTTIIASGVSSLFSSVFGAPLTGTILATEICHNKKIKKSIYFLPILLSACFSRFVCFALGLDSFIDRIIYIHHSDYNLEQIIPILILIGICLIFALLYNKILKSTKNLFRKIKNEYIRISLGSLIMIGCIYLIGNTLFCGNDTILIEKALENNQMWYTFILKNLLTALCLAIGFKGGKIGPALISGTTLGILIASLIGIDPQMGAAIGLVTLFGGVTGCYITVIFLGIEIFGLKSIAFFIIIALSIKLLTKQNLIERKL